MAESRKNPASKRAAKPEPTPDLPETEETPAVEASSNGKAKTAKDPALYHVYKTADEGKTLEWLTDVTAKTAEAAVSEAVKADETLVGVEIVVAPNRNLKTFKSEVKTTTRVKVTAA